MATTGSDVGANSRGFIKFELKNASKMKNARNSNRVHVGGLTWYVNVQVFEDDLKAFLYIDNNNETPIWSLEVESSFKLINVDASKCALEREITSVYNKDNNGWGVVPLARMAEVLDEKQGFIQDDTITLEVRFTVEKWSGFRKPLSFDFTDSSNPCFDVALVIEGSKVHVGRQTLAMHSPVFHTMFYGNFAEKNKKEIELKDLKREEFIDMLNVLYPSHCPVTANNVMYLLKLGDRFEIKFILDKCEKFLKEKSKLPLIERFKISDDYRLPDLQGSCIRSFRNVEDIFRLKDNATFKALSNNGRSTLLFRAMTIFNNL